MLADQVVGWATLELPWRDNLELARMRIIVHPDRRRQGLGTRLLELVLAAAIENGRTSIATLAWVGTDGVPFLAARGFSTSGQHPYEVRRLDLHGTPTARWQELYDEAAPRAADYELSPWSGPRPTTCSTAWSPCTRRSTTRLPTPGWSPTCGTWTGCGRTTRR